MSSKYMRLPFTSANKNFTKSFINKLEFFTNSNLKLSVTWSTHKKMHSLFKNENNALYCNCVI